MDNREFDLDLRRWLSGVSSLEQLRSEFGGISEGERAELEALGFYDEPTPEELAAFGPDFVHRVMERVEMRSKALDWQWPSKPIDWGYPVNPLISEGFAVIRLLEQVEERANQRGEPAPVLVRKATQIAERLADVVLDDLERLCV